MKTQNPTDQTFKATFLRGLRKLVTNPLTMCAAVAMSMSSCASSGSPQEIRVSVADQKVALIRDGKPVKVYKCSTSKFGMGDRVGGYTTPICRLAVAAKIGAGQPIGRVFHGRQPSREIVKPNSPGRDPIVTRIMWLRGTEQATAKAYSRCIYIHGTPEEVNIGRPASYGCVRMKSKDVIDLFDRVPVGMPVNIVKGGLNGEARRIEQQQEMQEILPPTVSPDPIFPPMEPSTRPGQSSSTKTMLAKNGKPRLGPEISSKQRTKRVAKN